MAAANLPKFSFPANDGVIARFVEYVTVEKGLSPLTIEAYRADLEQLSQFLAGRQLASAGRRDIGAFILALFSNEIEARSVRRKVSTLRSFYRCLLLDGLIQTDPMDRIESIKVGRVLPKALLSESEIAAALEGLRPHCKVRRDERMRLRDRAALELLYGSGLRVTELVNACTVDVNLADRCIHVRGKGDKQRVAPFGYRAAEALREYLAPRSDSLPWLFPGQHKRQLTRHRMWQIVQRRLQRIGLQEKVSPHGLRHACATHMMNNGADLRTVQTILGHADISTTEIYTHTTVDGLKKIYLQCHPRATGKSRQLNLQLDLMPPEILATGPVLCSQCSKVALPSKTRCEMHLQKNREALRRFRKRAARKQPAREGIEFRESSQFPTGFRSCLG